jgi:aminopeptidase
MKASDHKKLAHQFMVNAVKVQKGDNVWIEYKGAVAKEIANACAAQVEEVGGHPFMVDSSADTLNATVSKMSIGEIAALGEQKLADMKRMQGYIRISDDAESLAFKLTDEQSGAHKAAMGPMIDYRVNSTRWLVTAAPTESFAKACRMDIKTFERFYRDVCLADYSAMTEAVKPLVSLMTEGKKVRIHSPNQETDLTFSIEGIPAIPCTGTVNIPDGECFTAPVKESINGTIKYGPSVYDGQRFEFIKLKFEKGRVVEAQAENEERTARLNKMLDADEGARYAGEFAVNFNPFIQHPVGNILFDEKIDGGVHIALGACYDEAPNGNKSVVHWDMVHIQRKDYGGGELYIDDRLIRKDGIFVVPELFALNPENLKAAAKSPKATMKVARKP